jgi:hypothetical protein
VRTLLGLIFFSLLAVLGMLLTISFLDLTGQNPQPVLINGTPLSPPDLGPVKTLLSSGGTIIQRTNPLEPEVTAHPPESDLPTMPPLPTLLLTPTPVPPLDPIIYRVQVMQRLKDFSTALNALLSANDQLAQNNTLLEDPTWRKQTGALLEEVSISGQTLSAVGPPPPEYAAIDDWLNRVGSEAAALQANYQQGMDGGDMRSFAAAGNNLTNIKEYLSQSVAEMAKAGWPMQ